MKLVSVSPSPLATKKLVAVFEMDDGKTRRTHFGARNYDDYTITHDKEQRDRYWTRHAKDLKTEDPTKAGFCSLFILWGKYTSVKKNVAEYKRLFDL